MGIFDTIKHAIFGEHGPLGHYNKDTAAPATAQGRPAPAQPPAPTLNGPAMPAPSQAPAVPAPTAQPVDVEAILAEKARTYGKPNNWRTSIVDLLTLLGLDSSLGARKELGQELGVHAGADGSAEQNIALHRAVMKALAENGGKVPTSLTD